MVSLEREGGIVVLKLDRSVTNPINLSFAVEIGAALEKLKDDPGINGIVIGSSSEKFFSIGFDLPELIKLDREGMQEFFRAFNKLCLQLYTLPIPTVTAVSAHAVAGGCILALCSDYRYIGEGRRLMGLNEIKLGVPLPYLSFCILENITAVRIAREIIYSGELYGPDDLSRMGMVDGVFVPEELLAASVEKARKLGGMPKRVFSAMKRESQKPVLEKYEAGSEEGERVFLDSWFSEETRVLLNEALEKF